MDMVMSGEKLVRKDEAGTSGIANRKRLSEKREKTETRIEWYFEEKRKGIEMVT